MKVPDMSLNSGRCYRTFASCKVIRIPESMKFLLVESGILGIGIQNPAKEWIQNSFVENPFRIVLTAFTRIHATTVMLKRRPQTADRRPCRQCRPRLFRWEFRLLNSTRYACSTNMATDHTFPITINFEKRYMDIYGSRMRSISEWKFLHLNVNRFLWYLAFRITKFKIL